MEGRTEGPRLSYHPAVDDPATILRGDITVVVTAEPDQTVAHVSGEIDVATCKRLHDAIAPHLEPGRRLILDLSGVTFMDSACLNVLEQARSKVTATGGSLILRNPSGPARRLLSAASAAAVFDMETEFSQDSP